MERALFRQLWDRHRELKGEPAASRGLSSGAAAGGRFYPRGGSSAADGQREDEEDIYSGTDVEAEKLLRLEVEESEKESLMDIIDLAESGAAHERELEMNRRLSVMPVAAAGVSPICPDLVRQVLLGRRLGQGRVGEVHAAWVEASACTLHSLSLQKPKLTRGLSSQASFCCAPKPVSHSR